MGMTGLRLRTPAAMLAAAALTVLSACGGEAAQPAEPASPGSTPPVSSAPPPSASPGTASPGTASPPTASPTPAGRSLTEANLLAAADIPSPDDSLTVKEVAERRGRRPGQISICFPAGAGDLGATQMESRNFRFVLADPDEGESEADGPDPRDPSIYTVALQFPDAASAQQARKTIRGWVADCRKTLRASGTWRPIRASQESSAFHPVKVSGAGEGAWAEVPLYRAKTDRSDNGFFETVGLTLSGDRLMVTVDLLYGMDKISSDQQGGDPDSGVPADRQFDLVKAAAKRLAR
jgi:hypothetical protein